jgi:hypothetical protein
MLCSDENAGSVCRRFQLALGWEDPERTPEALGERLQSGGRRGGPALIESLLWDWGGTCSVLFRKRGGLSRVFYATWLAPVPGTCSRSVPLKA